MNNLAKLPITLSQKLASIEETMASAAASSPLVDAPARVLGASKGQSESTIEEAIAAGLLLFGENKVQEAKEKWEILRSRHPEVCLHLIGPLQTNKVAVALELFDAIQTLDRVKLADAIKAEWTSHSRCQQFYIQVNTGKEEQKAGVMPDEADAFIEYCRQLGLPVVGLMCVPPFDQPAAPHFALLRSIALRHELKALSMGMSEDFETAVRMGSTCVRIGRSLFGERH
jgi:pyridoxal phosphate enzyme (YggS family)